MLNFQRCAGELAAFCMKHDVRKGIRVTIVLKDEREKAYFVKGLREELQPPHIESDVFGAAVGGDFKMHGIEFRILA